jgi:hypothetical protein
LAAWWWLLTRKRARVILTAPSFTQVDEVLWAEVRRLYRSAVVPLGGKMSVDPGTGYETADGRQIIGFSTDKPERAAGFSSPNILIIVDEASGYDRKIFEALLGNMAGGARILQLSNPTQTTGYFYDSFHTEGSTWVTHHMSSIDCAREWPLELGPDAMGLATLKWCEDLLRDFGPEDPRYHVRVLGNFPANDENSMIVLSLVTPAQSRWTRTPGEGPLQFGVDTARFGTDYSAIAWSRGLWVSEPFMLKGCDNVEVAGHVKRLIREHRRSEDERVEVRIDTSNNGGVADILRAGDDDNIDVVDMVASASATEGTDFSRLRDEVWGGLRAWLKAGGSLPPCRLLQADILSPRLGFDERGKQKVESKKEMRRRIGRSTDRADAVALAVYQEGGVATDSIIFGGRAA